jgi:hypothetical protein
MGKVFGNLAALGGVALAALFLVAPSGAGPTSGPHDFAVGGFSRANGAHIGFSAHSGPTGSAAVGHLSSTFDNNITGTGTIKERFRVVCLAVAGNQAAIGLVPTDSPPDNAGTPRVLSVQDSGLPGGTGDLYAFVDTAPTNCAAALGLHPFAPLSGNILVHHGSI